MEPLHEKRRKEGKSVSSAKPCSRMITAYTGDDDGTVRAPWPGVGHSRGS